MQVDTELSWCLTSFTPALTACKAIWKVPVVDPLPEFYTEQCNTATMLHQCSVSACNTIILVPGSDCHHVVLLLQVNTSVYVTGLPDDTDVEELLGVFSKCGVIKEDEKMQPKIKIYK